MVTKDISIQLWQSGSHPSLYIQCSLPTHAHIYSMYTHLHSGVVDTSVKLHQPCQLTSFRLYIYVGVDILYMCVHIFIHRLPSAIAIILYTHRCRDTVHVCNGTHTNTANHFQTSISYHSYFVYSQVQRYSTYGLLGY